MAVSLVERLAPPPSAPLPGRHLGLTWRDVAARDIDAIDNLTRITEKDNAVVRRTPSRQLRGFLDEACQGHHASAIVGVDSDGDIQAFGLVRLYREDREVARAELFAATMPKWRGRGIGRALLTWQDARARQLLVESWGPESTLPARISNVVESHQRDRRQLYVAAGYAPTSFLGVYRHSLRPLPPAPVLPDGYRVRALDLDGDLVDVRRLHDAKAAGQGASRVQAERWWRRVIDSVDAELSSVCADANGRISAFALVCRHSTSWIAGVDADAAIEASGPTSDDQWAGAIARTLRGADAENFEGVSIETVLRGVDGRDVALEAVGFTKIGVRMVYTVDL
ncbi:GNAT family N-acetyltransferase [Nanchangia anserum]|uniref:GNAT family N-acetyltransferase n=1 Tax=Nanchangia anserum TaxID=2692125 RepID=A0A8I0KN28_9ACTO|nr:GNAT family N-acetyltransferase [Nanchangia anserum]MBD3688836.1 GNAT family N-acetyltransferase [Nanchangia anserum]QOX81110.1 GNAT family N-acetyltransferase [Nanchangia anserum]